jgi:hypothetical protein
LSPKLFVSYLRYIFLYYKKYLFLQSIINTMAFIKCSECGNEISDKAKFCINCGVPIEVATQAKEIPNSTAKQAPPQSGPSDLNQHKGTETNYYSRDGVKITNTRFIVENTTYPINGITSVRTSEIPPNKTGSIFLIVLGAILTLLGFSSNGSNITIAGVIFIVIGIIWLMSLKTWYALRISTSAGEKDAVTSKDEDYIRHIAALNEAIIHRG